MCRSCPRLEEAAAGTRRAAHDDALCLRSDVAIRDDGDVDLVVVVSAVDARSSDRGRRARAEHARARGGGGG